MANSSIPMRGTILFAATLLLVGCVNGPIVDEYRFTNNTTLAEADVSAEQIRSLRSGFVAVCVQHHLRENLPGKETFGWLHYYRDFKRTTASNDEAQYLVALFIVEGERARIELRTSQPTAEANVAFRLDMEKMITRILGNQSVIHSERQIIKTFS